LFTIKHNIIYTTWLYNYIIVQNYKYVLETSSLESSTKNLQLDRRKKMQKFDDISSTDILHSPNLQVCIFDSLLFINNKCNIIKSN